MELALRQRTTIKGSITKAIKHLENKDLTETALKRLDEQFKQLSKDASNINTTILQLANEAEAESAIKDYDELADRIFTAELRLADRLQQAPTSQQVSSSGNPSQPSPRTHTLPKLSLPSFSGLSKDWLSFSDLFTATITNNQNISNAQKLQFLKTCLSDQPLQLIQSLAVTDHNFDIAWTLLKERFHHPRELLNAHIKKLMDQPELSADKPEDLRQLVDTTSEFIRTLDTLGRTNKMGNDLMTHLVLQRIDVRTKRAWELELKHNQPAELDDLLKFIEQRARALTLVDQDTVLDKTTKSHVLKTKSGRATAHLTVANSVTEVLKCDVCSKPHQIWKCQTFLDKSPQQRKQIVQSKKLCFNCLGVSHAAHQCTKTHCKKCERKHHTLLHFQATNKPGSSNYVSSTEQSNRSENHYTPTTLMSNNHNVIMSNIGACNKSYVLLQTAIVYVQDKWGKTQPVRALLDGGSQGHFLSESCAQRLQLQRQSTEVLIEGLTATTVVRGKSAANVKITSHMDPTLNLQVQVFIVPKVTGMQPREYINEEAWKDVRNLSLADTNYNRPGSVELLLGAEIIPLITTGRQITGQPGQPHAIDTKFGWVLTGRVGNQEVLQNTYISVNTAAVTTDEMLPKLGIRNCA